MKLYTVFLTIALTHYSVVFAQKSEIFSRCYTTEKKLVRKAPDITKYDWYNFVQHELSKETYTVDTALDEILGRIQGCPRQMIFKKENKLSRLRKYSEKICRYEDFDCALD
ncbi:hypothetical protein MRY82_00090 [bacterium]|nr:hypothetical protein [bacterium]